MFEVIIVSAILGAMLAILFLTQTRLGGRLIEQNIESKSIQTEIYQDEVRQENWEEHLSKRQGKDYSLLSIFYEENLYKEDFQKTYLGYHTVKLLQDKGLMDDEIFDFLRKDKSSTQLLKTFDEMSADDKRKRYHLKEEHKIIYGDEIYFVASNWGIGNIGVFMDKIEDKFPKIEFTISER